MLCYKDMTFCINEKCKRACKKKLTVKITQEAEKLGLPIACSNYICTDMGDEDADIQPDMS